MTNPFDESSVDWGAFEAAVDGVDEEVPDMLTPEILTKRIVWDTVPHKMAQEIAAYIGLPPSSDEVATSEHDEAHMRMLLATPVLPFLGTLAHAAAESITGAIIVGQGLQESVPEEERVDAVNKTYPIIFQSALAIIAELIDCEVLHTPHGFEYVIIGGAEE